MTIKTSDPNKVEIVDGRLVFRANKAFVLRHDHLSHVYTVTAIEVPRGYVGWLTPTWDLMHGYGVGMVCTWIVHEPIEFHDDLTFRMTCRKWKYRTQIK